MSLETEPAHGRGGLPGIDDPFLAAVSRHRDDRVVEQSSASVRWLLTGLILAALVAIPVLLTSTGDRSSTGSAADRLAASDQVVDLAVTAPYVGKRVVLVDHQAAAIVASETDEALLRRVSTDVGAIVGLADADSGAVVALAALPAGLELPDGELLVSPVSTALAVASLHPDLLVADRQTHLAHVIAAARSPLLADLAAMVDGDAAVNGLGEPAQATLDALVGDALARTTASDVDGDCAERAADVTFLLCPSTGEYLNLTSASVLVVDGADEPCGVVPSATRTVSPVELTALATVFATGVLFPEGVPAGGEFRAGRFDAGAECGEGHRPVRDPNSDRALAEPIVGYQVFYDAAAPLASFLGAPSTSVDAVRETARPEPALSSELEPWIPNDVRRVAPAGRFRLAVALVQSPTLGERLGLGSVSPAGIELDGLRGLLLGLYS